MPGVKIIWKNLELAETTGLHSIRPTRSVQAEQNEDVQVQAQKDKQTTTQEHFDSKSTFQIQTQFLQTHKTLNPSALKTTATATATTTTRRKTRRLNRPQVEARSSRESKRSEPDLMVQMNVEASKSKTKIWLDIMLS